MPKWFLVRHGETEWNVEGRAQGSSDTELSEVGLYQAERLSARLAHTSFAAIYYSDLSRAMQTAQMIHERSNAPLLTTPELRELSYGVWEGMTYGEVQARYPALYAQLMKGDVKFTPPGGESVKDLLGRVKLLAQRLGATHPNEENILIVGHGGSIRGLLIVLLDLPAQAFWRFRLAPGSISIISITYPERATLDIWNDTTHLEESRSP